MFLFDKRDAFERLCKLGLILAYFLRSVYYR
jgi:hypothetical protein